MPRLADGTYVESDAEARSIRDTGKYLNGDRHIPWKGREHEPDCIRNARMEIAVPKQYQDEFRAMLNRWMTNKNNAAWIEPSPWERLKAIERFIIEELHNEVEGNK